MKGRSRFLYGLLLLFSTLFSQEFYFPKAKVTYSFFDQTKTYYSNDITLDSKTITPPNIKFFSYNTRGNDFILKLPKYKTRNGYLDISLPSVKKNLISLSKIKVRELKYIRSYDSLFLEVDDMLSNKNSSKIDTILVRFENNDDYEEMIFYETDKNSGIFRGYVRLTNLISNKLDGQIYLKRGSSLKVSLGDRYDTNIKISSLLRSLDIYSNQNIWLENKTTVKVVSSGEYFKTSFMIKNSSNHDITSTLTIFLNQALKIKKDSLKVDNHNISYQQYNHTVSSTVTIPANSKKLVSYIVKVGMLKELEEVSQNIKYMNNTMNIKIKVANELLKDNSSIIGKVSFGTKGIKGVKIYLENGVSTITDKRGRYHFEGIEPDFHVVKVDPTTIEDRFAITTCEEETNRFADSQTTQFVDTSIAHISKANFCVKYIGSKKNSPKSKKKIVKPKTKKMPKYTKNSFSNSKNKILWPTKDFIPSFPSVKLAFMHQSKLKAKVFINNTEVDKLVFDGFEISKDKKYKIEKYRGVSIKDGDNTLVIKLLDKDKIVSVLTRNIHFSTSATSVKVIKKLSNLKADGTHIVTIAVKLFDRDGYPVRSGMIGECSISEPYYFQQNSLNKIKYKVEEDGITYIKLKPTSISGIVKLHFDFMDDGKYLSSWLQPAQKGWVVVGFAKGSFGYNTLKKKMSDTKEKSSFKNGKVSFFARGKVSDETILTIAYNSAKKVDLSKLEDSSLKKTYFVYADASTQSNEAPSSSKLYLKLERDSFYTLFGDFKTELTQTKLAKYKAKVHGIKSEYHGKDFEYTAFVSKSKTIHNMDEIKPDGTSGKYFLKTNNILKNSESIYIVTRDKNDYDKVISEQRLTKDSDYNINYDEGYIYFKEAQFSTDDNFNPKYIVVHYESEGGQEDKLTYGVHARIKSTKNIKTGVTYIKSDRGMQQSELKGIDVMMKLYKDVEITMEGAVSKNNNKKATANLQEIKYHHNSLTVKAYNSYTQQGFGIENQENIRDLDAHIRGVKADYSIDHKVNIEFKQDRKVVLSSKEKENIKQINLSHKGNSYYVLTGYKEIQKDDQKDKKAVATIRKNFLNSKIVTQLSKVKSLNSSIFEPDETILKVNYLLNSKVKIFAQNRISELKDEKTKQTKAGVTITPWTGATTNTSITKEESTDSFSMFADYGILQNIRFNKNLNIRLGYDEKKSLKGEQKFDDYKSYTSSVDYKKNKWKYKAKLEYKDAQNDKINSSFGAYSKVNTDYAVAFGIRESKIISDTNPSREISSTIAVSYRPKKGDSIVLNKLEYKNSKNKDDSTQKLINNLYADTKLSRKTTLDAQFGLKYLESYIDGEKNSDLVGLIGLSFIYDLNKKISINSQVSMTFSLDDKTYEYSAGSSLGYSPFRDGLIYLGYNLKGFNDEDFDSDVYRQDGAYVNFMLKFDEFSLSERAKRSIE